MDSFLRQNLLACLAAYIGAAGGKESTIAQRAAGDWRFFKRISDHNTTFTIKKYDDVLNWFDLNWPIGCEWPSNVPRPGVPFIRETAANCVSLSSYSEVTP